MGALVSDLVNIGIVPRQAAFLGDTQQNSITANGLTQGTAIALTASICRVTVVTATNNGVILPPVAAAAYGWVLVRNDDAADTLNVWPATGEAMNGLVNTPIGIVAGAGKVFAKMSTGWVST